MMTLGEVIELLTGIFNMLMSMFGSLFGKEEGDEGETTEEAQA